MQREKRVSRAPKIFSPDDVIEKPTHYLLYFDLTDSYTIALNSSVKKITEDQAILNIQGKRTIGTIMASGTYETCENEQRKITRESQQSYDQNNLVDEPDRDGNEDNDEPDRDENEDNDEHVSSHRPNNYIETSSVINRRLTPQDKHQAHSQLNDEYTDSIQHIDDNDSIDVLSTRLIHSNVARNNGHRKTINKKRKKAFPSSGQSKRSRPDVAHTEINQQTIEHSDPIAQTETNLTNRLNILENNFAINQSTITKTLKRLEKKFDYQLSANGIQGSKILDQYRTQTGETFPSEYMYGNRNLLCTIAKDLADFARKTLRILFSSDELKSHILPPAREHLKRPPLDEYRFNIFLESIRIKFRFDRDLMSQCFNDILRTKLSNYLYEERRRESRRKLREKERLLTANGLVEQIDYIHHQNSNDEHENMIG